MRTRIMATLAAMAIAAVAMLFTTPSAHAQPCAQITVTNFTNCQINLCLYDVPGNQICLVLGPTGTVTSIGFLNGFMPVGAISAGKNQYPFAGNPFCTPCIRIPGASVVMGCCAEVCYDVNACTISVTPCGGICLP